MGTLRKRGAKWYYRIDLGSVDNKRTQVEKGGFRTQKEAYAAMTKAENEYNQAGLVFTPSEITLSDYMDFWMDTYVKNLAYNTIVDYSRVIKLNIKPYIGKYKLKSITPMVVQKWIDGQKKKDYAPSTIQGMFCVLSGAMKYAVHPAGFIQSSPCAYVHSYVINEHKGRGKVEVLPDEDYEKIMERFPADNIHHIAFVIGHTMGLRIGECYGLTWDNIDFEKKIATIDKQIIKVERRWCLGALKTEASYRTIPLTNEAINELKIKRKWYIENKLKYGEFFTNIYTKHENDRDYIYELSSNIPPAKDMKKLELINIKENGHILTSDSFKSAARVIHYIMNMNFHYHQLRHTFATKLVESGANIKGVQNILGHSRYEVTVNTYVHDTEMLKKQAIQCLENEAK